MKLLIATIRPAKLPTVQASLAKHGIRRMTVTAAQGYARQREGKTPFLAEDSQEDSQIDLLRKISLEIAVNDDFVDRAIAIIEEVAQSSSDAGIGDGKIYVVPIEEAIDFTGKRGPGVI